MRKLKKISLDVKETQKKLLDLQEAADIAAEEEKAMLDDVKILIDELCSKHDLFCGVILSPQDIGSIVELMASRNGNVKIGYTLYAKED
jgi:hypothetical protein